MGQTLGQQRVKAEFNPSKDDIVSKIKDKSAELIDLLETLRDVTEGGSIKLAPPQRQRVISIAQTDVETACMYGVKAVFTK